VLDQTGEDLDKKLNECKMILDFVEGFEWRYGEKMVHYKTGNVGLQAQWLEAWWPSSDDEFAFVVEDDIELSPLYYSPWVYGASLQRPRELLPDRVVNSVNELEPVLNSAQKANALLLVSIYRSPETCGHPMINVDRLFDSIEEFKLISFRKEIAVKAYVTKKALEMKYDTWVLVNVAKQGQPWSTAINGGETCQKPSNLAGNHYMIPVKAEFFLNSVKLDFAVDFYVGERLGLLFARSSGIWTNHFVNEVARMPESSLSNDEDGFGFWSGKILEKKGVKLQRVN
ncbi:hypothetical protein Tco_0879113, partial [Tanacetum coccineum]